MKLALNQNFKNFTLTGANQLIIQLIGVVSGILVVRLLPTSDYALFTLANTMLGTMTVLADGGISSSIMAQGGQVWKDKKSLGKIVQTGINLRTKFSYISLLFAVPLLYYFLTQLHADKLSSSLIIIILIPLFFLSFANSLLQIGPKLHQDVVQLQRNQLVLNIARLVLLVLLYFIPSVYIALAVGIMPLLWSNANLKKISKKYIDFDQDADENIKSKMYATVKRVFPTSLYYCLSSQITLWLISVLGTSYAVAQLGALARYGALFNVFTILIATLIIPKYAKLPSNKSALFSSFLKITATLIMAMLGILACVHFFATPLLSIIGRQYAGLEYELLLSMVGSCVSLLAGTLFSLYIARGWVINPLISIPINLIVIIAGIMILNPSSIENALMLNILIAAGQLVMNLVYILIKINKVSNENAAI